jgi:alpha-beta hydrolase superfamily lysophospholipase
MLKPPKLNGLERQALRQRIQASHPTWSEEVVGATMGNFESIPGGKVKPNLSLEHHMAILRAMYDQETQSLYQHVKEPVLICVAVDGSQWAEMKRSQLEIAQAGIANSEVIWFKDAAHDIHQDRPDELSAAILKFMANIK